MSRKRLYLCCLPACPAASNRTPVPLKNCFKISDATNPANVFSSEFCGRYTCKYGPTHSLPYMIKDPSSRKIEPRVQLPYKARIDKCSRTRFAQSSWVPAQLNRRSWFQARTPKENFESGKSPTTPGCHDGQRRKRCSTKSTTLHAKGCEPTYWDQWRDARYEWMNISRKFHVMQQSMYSWSRTDIKPYDGNFKHLKPLRLSGQTLAANIATTGLQMVNQKTSPVPALRDLYAGEIGCILSTTGTWGYWCCCESSKEWFRLSMLILGLSILKLLFWFNSVYTLHSLCSWLAVLRPCTALPHRNFLTGARMHPAMTANNSRALVG